MREYKMTPLPLPHPEHSQKHPSVRWLPIQEHRPQNHRASSALSHQAKRYRPPLPRFLHPGQNKHTAVKEDGGKSCREDTREMRSREKDAHRHYVKTSAGRESRERRGYLGGRGRKDGEQRNCHLRIVSLWDDRKV